MLEFLISILILQNLLSQALREGFDIYTTTTTLQIKL